ncbi:non-ribosomal peptide synthase/polyketide synthase [Longimicrobium sp.]|uniref:non-ribosomal peptide synthase/polyketide synthase n=1 Tax=Longimicrobium sp. TaxID=2029185 RepID=UPI002CAA9972|nr:non-ribosomal peptide synthase/polyketide synthase [Longimicrobium sp.]HSU14717.1 non-ribosomal peptide synthase/polyketide synthase [Longimicrobium sp.]
MNRKDLEAVYPLSPLQQGMLFHTLDAPEAGAYAERLVLRTRGALDADAFRRAWQLMVDRHAALRTAFVWENVPQPLQAVLRKAELPFAFHDWSAEPDAEARLEEMLREEGERPFALGRPPLLRVMLARLPEGEHVLAVSMHHALTDGWSLSIVLGELFTAYAAYLDGVEPELPARRPFREYIAWLARRDPVAAEAFWRQRLAGFRAPTPVPLDAAPERAGMSPEAYGRAQQVVAPALGEALREAARRRRVTLNTLLHAAWAALLARHTGTGDVVFATTVSGRPPELPGVEGMVGMFLNTLPVRIPVDGDAPVDAWLAAVQDRAGEATRHEHVPLTDIRAWTELPAGAPLFETLFVLENHPAGDPLSGEGPEDPRIPYFTTEAVGQRTNFALAVTVTPAPHGLVLTATSDAARLDDAAAARLLAGFESILRQIAAGDARTVGDLDPLTEAERALVLRDLNATETEYPRDLSIHRLFEHVAAARPDAVALRTDAGTVTYGELNARANRLARRLIALGVAPESRVGVAMERSPELIAALLAILKAGGAYVPLDPGYPRARLEMMRRDAGVSVVIAAGDGDRGDWGDARVLSLATARAGIEAEAADDLPVDGDPLSIAYVVYTSGSTGTPKGAAVPHRAVVRLVRGQTYARFAADEVFLQLAPVAFDASTWEIWGALLNGGAVAIHPAGPADPRELGAFVRRHGVTSAWLTAGLFHQVVDAGAEGFAGVRHLLAGGDVLSPAHVRRAMELLPETRIVDGYGPTEATTFTCCHAVSAEDAERGAIPIGAPIANTRVYVVDARLRPVPPGAPGELLIAGDGLARGYLGRPALTAEKFVPDPFGTGGRLYRTGDLVRWTEVRECVSAEVRKCGSENPALPHPTRALADAGHADPVPSPVGSGGGTGEERARERTSDGEEAHGDSSRDEPTLALSHPRTFALQFLGRIDQQVKIRGFRVEPGEVEAVLAHHPAVAGAAVDVRADASGEKRLVAWIVPAAHLESAAYGDPGAAVHQWEGLFDDLYAGSRGTEDGGETFDIVGWNCSYTGQPITAAEMHEWADATVARILALGPRRVLEIGVGTGLLLFRIAPDAESYTGTDVSAQVLETLRGRIARNEEGMHLPPVTLLHREAADFSGLEPRAFDTAILNSVSQYFPGAEYLARVVQGVAEALGDGGSFFIGDVRALPTLPAFRAAVELGRADADEPAHDVLRRARHAADEEEELVVDPDFFAAVAATIGRGARAEARVKRGRHHNELTRHRYDVVLTVARGDAPAAAPSIDWRADGLSLDSLRARLAADAAPLAVLGIPDARVEAELRVLELLQSPQCPGTAGEVCAAVASAPVSAVDPEALWALGDELGMEVEIRPTGREAPGHVDALFRRPDVDAAFPPRALPALALDGLANDPARGTELRTLAPRVREWLQERLPEHLVPSAVVVLDALPLTPNGKVDRRALPDPDPSAPAQDEKDETPLTPTEELLAGIWREVLGAERVGPGDDFFALGGHSLLAMRLVSRARALFEADVPVRAVFEAPTLRALALRIDALRGGAETAPPLVPLEGDGPAPLSFGQERVWLTDRLAAGEMAYAVVSVQEFPEDADAAVLSRALDEVARRHPPLRTVFRTAESGPVQEALPPSSIPLPVQDLREMGEAERDAAVMAAYRDESVTPFDLERGPIVRARLLRVPGEARLVVSIHHIVSDGWSMAVLHREMRALYAAFSRGLPSPLPELPVRYADWAAWQRRWMAEGGMDEQTGFWSRALAGAPPAIDLPADRPRVGSRGFEGADRWFRIPPATARAARALAQREGATLFMVLLASVDVLLARVCGTDDVVVGTPVAGRTRPETEGLIGFFVNMLPLRADLSGQPSFREVVARVRRGALDAYAHQDVPFQMLVDALGVERTLRHSPIFQVSFALQTRGIEDAPALEDDDDPSGFPTDPAPFSTEFELGIDVRETGEALLVRASYSTGRFDDETALRLVQRWERLLAALLADPAAPVHAHDVLDDAERRALLAAPSGEIEGDEDTLATRFLRVAAERADAPAVVYGGETLSYADVADRAGRLAAYLRERGVRPESRVAVVLERGMELPVALLGILGAGGAFVCIDPAYPAERIAWMLEDSGAVAVVTHSRHLPALPATVPVIALDVERDAIASASPAFSGDVDAANAAYVVYTSGSTGQPKGVVVTHRAVLGYARAAVRRHGFRADDRMLQQASPSFDASVLEMFGAWEAGAAVVVAPPGPLAPAELARLVAAGGVTLMAITAAVWHEWVRELEAGGAPVPPALRLVMVGGERMHPAAAAAWLRHSGATLQNLYGVSECTVTSTAHDVRAEDGAAPEVPVGGPIAGTRLYVLDARLRPAPPGTPGELWIAGAGLARGYHGRPALTAERFTPDPLAAEPGARMYRTGDRARWKESAKVRECGSASSAHDGRTSALPHSRTFALEYLGRTDRQLKVRGVRVEPGEIEEALRAHPAVADAAVDVRGTPARVVAWVVPAGDEAPTAAALRGWLAARLPAHLLPAAIAQVPRLPLNASGKVDRAALAEPAGDERTGTAPATPTELVLAEIWGELLGRGAVHADDDFFLAGGHSLLAMTLVTHVRQRLGVQLLLAEVFEHPLLADLAAHVDALPRLADEAAPERLREGDAPLSFAQERLWFIDRMDPGTPVYNLPHPVRLRGALDLDALLGALREMVRRHAVLRTRFAVADGHAVQRVESPDTFQPGVDDLSALAPEEREAELARVNDDWCWAPFDLERGPLFRARVLRLAADDHALLVAMHHAVSDGWSMGVFRHELLALYEAFRRGEPSPLAELPLTYAEFAVWQRSRMAGGELERQLAWWRDALSGAPPVLELPTDRPRAARPSQRGGTVTFAVPARVAGALRALAHGERATLFMVLLAAWDVLMSRWSGQTDLVVGTPVAGRTHRDTEGLIGFFSNILPLRADLSGGPAFRALVGQVRDFAMGAFAHQEASFEKIVEELVPDRVLNHAPLVQVLFQLLNTPEKKSELGDLEIDYIEVETRAARVDMTTGLVEMEDGSLRGAIEYATDLFDPDTVERLAARFVALLRAAAATPDASVAALPLLSAEERGEVLALGAAAASFPVAETLHGRFAARAAEAPDAPALTFEGATISYAELDARANRLANHLRATGVGPESLVGLCVERSLETVIGILAILKAGGGYLPLDPAYPADRLAYMLDDSGAEIVVTTAELAERIPAEGRRLVRLDADAGVIASASPESPEVELSADALAYVIYTSGSTGRPKGVQVTHGNALRLFDATDGWFRFGAGDVWTLFHSYAFDFSVWEIWGALLYGGRVVVVPFYVSRSPEAFLRLLADERVTVLSQTPGAFRQLIRADEEAGTPELALREVVFGGEALDPATLRGWVERRGIDTPRLVNMYGITETTVHVTFRVVTEDDVRTGGVSPIGVQIPDLSVHVLDPRGEPVPLGVPGEMHVGGAGVARGYLGRPSLTAQRFIPDPFSGIPGARLYRSGDRARWTEVGEYESARVREWNGTGAPALERPTLAQPDAGRADSVPPPGSFGGGTGEERARERARGGAESHRDSSRDEATFALTHSRTSVRRTFALQYLGRIDDQVKIRGFRIELGEIESVLRAHPAVREAVVLARGEGDEKRLVAWTVAEGDAPSAAELREHALERLPEYMVPSAFVALDALPLTRNGKVDRRALPDPATDASGDYVPPRTQTEEVLASVWAELLGVERVGADDGFFALGGHSLLATRVVSRVREAFGVELPLRATFEQPTLSALAAEIDRLLRADGGTDAPPIVATARDGDAPLSFAQERMWFVDRLEPGSSIYHMPFTFRVRGALDTDAFRRALDELVARHESLRTSFPLVDGTPVQRVHAPRPADFVVHDLSGPRANEFAATTAQSPFGTAALPSRHESASQWDKKDKIGGDESSPAGDGASRVREGGLRAVVAANSFALAEAVEPGAPGEPVKPGSLASEADADIIARDAAERAFDVENGPLFRAVLVRTAEDEHLLVLNLHHLISDGWSYGVLARELAALYGAFRRGEPSPLAPLPIQYADFAAWQRQWLQGEVLDAQLGYWRRKLAGAPPRLELPTDLPRPAVQRHRGRLEQLEIPADAADAIAALTRHEGATLFMTLLAAWSVVLARWAGQDDVVVGTPIAGRNRGETEPLVGLFLNSLALRTDLGGDPTFRELLHRVRETTLEAYAHQDVPFERILEDLHPERSLAHAPVFQVMLNLANFGDAELALPGVDVEPAMGTAEVGSKFDLTLYAAEWNGSLVFSLVYDAELFAAERMREMLAQLGSVLRQAAAAPERPVSALSLLTDEARAALPDPAAPLSAEWRGSVPALFAAHAQATPDALAAADPRERWTYAELDKATSRIARALAESGVAPGDVVAIWGHRSAALVRALVATLKTGAAFLVLDPAYPPARLAAYCRAAAPKAFLRVAAAGPVPDAVADALDDTVRRAITLGEKAERDGLFGVPAEAPQVEIGPDSLAYLSFTSGTTGEPKAVMGRHGSLTHFTPWLAETFGLGAADRFSMLSGLAHDPLHRDVFTPLQLGASVVAPVPESVGEPGYLAAWMREAGITIAHLTPAMGQLLGSADAAEPISTLRRAFFVGDVLTRTDVARLHALAPGLEVINYYGSTETQRAVSFFPVPRPASLLPKETVPAGIGLPDVQLVVRNPAGALAGVGEVGEIWMRSPHIALGYLGDEEMTGDRFAANPWTGDAADRMYRTGDLGRYRADGVVEIAGRADRQVKVRGFRIEPGEIEAVLRAHPAVADAAVLARGEGDARRLVAWIVSRDKTDNGLDTSVLRAYLAASVPEWMVPAAFVFIPALPLTPNGKLDRAALPDPELAAETYVAPRTETERALAAIWAELLDAEQVGAEDNFFHLGGHSLLATRLAARVRAAFEVDLPLRALFEHPTVAALAADIDARKPKREEAHSRTHALPHSRTSGEAEKIYPVTFAQQRLWLLDQLEPGNPAYNLAGGVRLRGALDVPALERAVGEVVRRHETLRTRIDTHGDEPVQVVSPPADLHLPIVDLPGADDAALAELLGEEGARPMDLARGPLFRAWLVRAGAEDHTLMWQVHHAVSDGWSTGVLVGEMAALYEAFAAGKPSPLPPLPTQYGEHAARERERLSGDALDREVGWWKRTLGGAPALLELPTDRPRPPVQSYRGGSIQFSLPAGMAARIDSVARREAVTPFMIVLAAFDAVLARWSGQTDVVVGTPIAGRATVEVEPLVGFFANTLALRADLSGDPAFRELLGRTREAAFGAFEHPALPFERLVEELAPERSLGHGPVFQVMLAWQNLPGGGGSGFGGLDVSMVMREMQAAKFDLSLALFPHGEGVEGMAEFATDLFDVETVERLVRQLGTLLDAALARPETRLSALPLLRPEERASLLRLSAGPAVDRAPGLTLHGMFEAQATRTPDAVAVTFEGDSLTYAEMDGRANQLAHLLRARGIGVETPVAVVMERSLEMVVALYGVLKAGAFYIPVEPEHPAERVAWMLEDSAARLVLTQRRWTANLPASAATVALDDAGVLDAFPSSPVDVDADPGALAYVIYTSGSTGKPKGAGNAHRGVVNRVLWMQETFGLDERDVVLQKTPFGFDVSVWEFFWPLMAGARLAVAAPGAHREPRLLSDAIRREGVTTLHFVPSMLQLWVDDASAASCTTLRRVMSSGEALPADLRDRFFARLPGVELHNLYGPTEAAVDVTWHPCAPGEGGSVPIGRPIANTRIHVLDAAGNLAPVGVPGELCIAGVQVARGYRGRPSLTAERFVPDPFSRTPGARMYRTGDRARWRSAEVRECGSALDPRESRRTHALTHSRTAVLEYLGRLDFQVKLRGLRIEPGEIEAALTTEPAVREAVVAVRPGPTGDPRLVAWVVAAEGRRIDAEALRDALGRRLPQHMVPAAFVEMPALPLTASGKVDRKALPDPDAEAARFVAPRTQVEEVLAGIWSEVLHRDRIGAGDDFFALGGHSLLATLVVSRVRDRLRVELPLRAIFESPRLAAMATAVESRMRDGDAPDVPPVEHGEGNDFPLSFAQERMWFLDRLEPGATTYNMSVAMRLRGALDADALARALAEVVRRHEPLRTVFAERDGHPVQHVLDADFHLPSEDLSGEDDIAAALDRRVAEFTGQPFDLARETLFRALLLRLGDGDHALLTLTHHAASDGWSQGIFFREMAAVYRAFAQGRPSPLAELPVRYADHAVWQRRWLAGEVLERQVAWWRERLTGAPALLQLPADHPRPALQSYRGAQHVFALTPETADAVHALARAEGATPFMVLLAAYQAVLARWSGQDDVVVGTPVAGRTRRETEGLMGLFVNTLALRGDLGGDPAFRELLGRVRETTLGAYAHQELPFERLVEELHPERSLGHAPVFQAMFVLQNAPTGHAELHGLEVSSIPREAGAAHVDLTLMLEAATGGGLYGTLDYATDLFRAETAERFAAHFATLLAAALRDPSAPVSALPLLGDGEREEMLRLAAGPATPFDATRTVAHRFAERARETPEAVAIDLQGRTLTYAVLDRLTSRAARLLRARGIGPETSVAMVMERSLESVLAFVATLKAGAFLVPIDPEFPAERIAWMLEDSGARLILTQERWMDRLPSGIDALALDTPGALEDFDSTAMEMEIAPESLAYVIYTSGSTGKPKGVAVPHAALSCYADSAGAQFAVTTADRVLHRTPSAFDPAVSEIWLALAAGAALVVAPPGAHADPAALAREIAERGATVIDVVPTLLAALLDEPAMAGCGALRLVFCGGEALPPALARRAAEILPHARLVNAYGPTETTITATAQFVDTAADVIPIGPPAPNVRAYVLDPRGAPSPLGVPGELAVGGAQVARGYWRRPALTAERFVPDPFAPTPGARMYRTGDRVRWCESAKVRKCESNSSRGEAFVSPTLDRPTLTPPDAGRADPVPLPGSFGRGTGEERARERAHEASEASRSESRDESTFALEFLGRMDFQLKLRGQRVEPGEVESALLSESSVREAVVATRPGPGGDPRLVAWVVAAEGAEISGDALRDALARRLPRHMVPSAVVTMDALPLAPGGKVDRAALPDPAASADGDGFVEPFSPTEIEMADLWSEVLGVPRVGAEDDFFALGGHSLLAVRLMARIRERFGRELPLAELFRSPTLAALAAAVDAAGDGGPSPTLVALHARGTRPPFFMVHPAGGTVFRYADLARALGPDQPLYGIQARGFSDDLPPIDDMDEMVDHYAAAIRAAFPSGPYLVGGWSAGGPIAFALAARLREMGEDAPLVVILDAMAPGYIDEPAVFDEVVLYHRMACDLVGVDPAAAAGLMDELRPLPPEEREAAVARWLARTDASVPASMARQIGRTVRVWAALERALDGWRPPFYEGDVLVVESEQGSPTLPRPAEGLGPGWAPYVGGRLEVRTVPGIHATFVLDPEVQAVAREIREALDAVASPALTAGD